VLVDIDLDTFNISLDEAIKKVTPKTKAVIVVDLFGLCVDIKLFKKNLGSNILVFEDAACAAGASLNGDMAGSVSHAAAFSFHPRKSITTGEGGMLTTQNAELAALAEKMRNHGAEISEEERHSGPAPYLLPEFNTLGFNYRMTDLQGAIGVEQLKKLESDWRYFKTNEVSKLPFDTQILVGAERWVFAVTWPAYDASINYPARTKGTI
jgi:dTDP-4-amino-4,6-dideoxygalactose transaminase